MNYQARAEDAAECLRLRSIAPIAAAYYDEHHLHEPGFDREGQPLATPTSGDEAALWQAVQALHAHNRELEAQVRGLTVAMAGKADRRPAKETKPKQEAKVALAVPSL